MNPQHYFQVRAERNVVLAAVNGKRHKPQEDSAEKKKEASNSPWQTPPLAWL